MTDERIDQESEAGDRRAEVDRERHEALQRESAGVLPGPVFLIVGLTNGIDRLVHAFLSRVSERVTSDANLPPNSTTARKIIKYLPNFFIYFNIIIHPSLHPLA